MDAVSDVLRVVRLDGAVYLHAELTTPWCLLGQTDQALCTSYLPTADRVVSYHLITEGACWAQLPDRADPAIRLNAGELLVVPQGEAHIMGSALDLAPVPARPLLETQLGTTTGELLNLSYGGGGAATRVLCGFLACDDALSNPVLGSLPRIFKVDVRKHPQSSWLEASLRFAAAEAAQRRAGSAIVLARLSELLFVWAVRRCIDDLPADRKNWLAGVKDRFVGRALSMLHKQPAYAWTVDELARNVGQSRSAFSHRFSDLLGQPPMQYLARWRLIVAAQELSHSSKAIAAIAEEVRYESESAFHRAFRREFNVPPAAWRKRHSHVNGAEVLAERQ